VQAEMTKSRFSLKELLEIATKFLT
jgi:hypothetical protein